MDAKQLVREMTLDEKIQFCSGSDYWHTKEIRRLGIPAIQMCDGPHGLRRQQKEQDNLGVANSCPATCFPAACLTACSFDPSLVRETAEAIGREALEQDVQMVLGPGINIKRDPLCGRNFEYFSEDPHLTGELGKAWIEGLQSTGVGACLKHYACNNQEDLRMSSDSIVDARALREIYLSAFKKALEAGPAALMTSYNKVNGEYMCENRALVDGLLRQKWGFCGIVVTDWGGMSDRANAFRAGVDLEMPGSRGFFDREVKRRVKKGTLSEESIDTCTERILETVLRLRGSANKDAVCETKAHHELSRKVAAASGVLLKNEKKILPVGKGARIALVGPLANQIRYQGTGSSHINPFMVSNLRDGISEYMDEITYYEGYRLSGEADEKCRMEAVEGCRNCDVVIIAAGLPEEYEAEGFDRRDMKLPEVQNLLIQGIAKENSNVVVVLFGGAPVEMPWASEVAGLLHMYLPGQAGGLAAADILFGAINPSGKLAESYPVRYSDTPTSSYYGKTGKQAQYRESIFVAYRYFEKKGIEVLFPFGFGLSYTEFEFLHCEMDKKVLQPGEGLHCKVCIRNTGGLPGAEVVQIYISRPGTGPAKELAGFKKVFLMPGEVGEVDIPLLPDVFTQYDTDTGDFIPAGGGYGILVGSSSRDIYIEESLWLEAAECGQNSIDLNAYIMGELTENTFEKLIGYPLPKDSGIRKGHFTRHHTLADMSGSWFINMLVWYVRRIIRKTNGIEKDSHPLFAMLMNVIMNTPIGRMSLLSPERMPKWAIRILLNIRNGRFWFAGE